MINLRSIGKSIINLSASTLAIMSSPFRQSQPQQPAKPPLAVTRLELQFAVQEVLLRSIQADWNKHHGVLIFPLIPNSQLWPQVVQVLELGDVSFNPLVKPSKATTLNVKVIGGGWRSPDLIKTYVASIQLFYSLRQRQVPFRTKRELIDTIQKIHSTVELEGLERVKALGQKGCAEHLIFPKSQTALLTSMMQMNYMLQQCGTESIWDAATRLGLSDEEWDCAVDDAVLPLIQERQRRHRKAQTVS